MSGNRGWDDIPDYAEITGILYPDLIEWDALFDYGIRSLEDFKALIEDPDSARLVTREVGGEQVPVAIVNKGAFRVVILPGGTILGAWVEKESDEDDSYKQ